MQSTGNTAIAMTHYAGVAAIPSWAFIPSRSAYKLLMPRKHSRTHILAVDGHPIDVKTVAEDFAACFHFPKVSPFYERCEANKTMAYEVAEAVLSGTLEEGERLKGRGFDFYVQTLSAGMGLIGFRAGMEYVQALTGGAIVAPRIAAIEISEFAPIHDAWKQGLEQVGDTVSTPFFPDHPLFEPTLWTTNIGKYYPHLRKMLASSDGLLDAVAPGMVLDRVEKYGFVEELRQLGCHLSGTENSPLIGFAGLASLVERGAIPKGSSAVLMVTGKAVHPGFVLERPDLVVDPSRHKPIDILSSVERMH
jgi:hypothetical protein